MSQRTPSSIASPGARPVSDRRTARLKNGFLAGSALSVIVLVFILVRLHSSHSAPPTPPHTDPFASSPAASSFGSPAAGSFLPPAVTNLSQGGRAGGTQMIATLRQRLQQHPGDLQSRIRLAALLDLQGDASDAEDVLRVALQRGQRKPEIFRALGMVYLRSDLYAPAAEAFYNQVRLAPRDFQAHLQLGTAYSYLGKADLAQPQFETAHKLNPSAPDPFLGLAYLNNTSERYPYAIQYLKEYLKRAPHPGPGYALLCRVYLNMALYDKAVEAGKRASTDLPDNSSVWYNLGVAHAYRPDARSLSLAAPALEHAARLAPNWGDAHFQLASVYSRLKRPADAIAQYREAVRCEPSQGNFYYQLGQLLVRQGQAAEGRQMLLKAQALLPLNQREHQLLDQLSATPNVPRLMFELAQVYRGLGKYDLAQNWLLAVMKADPNYPQARAELDAVRRSAATAPRP